MLRLRDGSVPSRHTSAFTMIEVLVVILIMGIIINFAVISLDVNNPSDKLKTEARRLASIMELASEEALLRSELIGMAIDGNTYEFFTFDEGKWIQTEDSVFRTRALPEEIRLELLTEQAMDTQTEESTQPGIVFMMSGEMTAFEIRISSEFIDDYFRLVGAETGALELDHVLPH